MKIKLPHWEIVLFIGANLFAVITYYPLVFLFLFAIGLIDFTQSITGYTTANQNLMLTGLMVFTFIFFNILLSIRLCAIFIIIKFIDNKGNKRYRLTTNNLKYSKTVKLKLISMTIVTDLVFLIAICIIPTLKAEHYTFFEYFKEYLPEYFLCGSLTLAYLTTFILWEIEDWIKKLRTHSP